MTKGRRKFFLPKREFGFLKPDAPGSPDIYVNKNTLDACGIKSLEAGQPVEFENVPSLRTGKPSAAKVRIITEQEAAAA
jgi:cold shock CspA family protein